MPADYDDNIRPGASLGRSGSHRRVSKEARVYMFAVLRVTFEIGRGEMGLIGEYPVCSMHSDWNNTDAFFSWRLVCYTFEPVSSVAVVTIQLIKV